MAHGPAVKPRLRSLPRPQSPAPPPALAPPGSPGHPAKAGGLSRSMCGGRPPRAPVSPSDQRFSSSPIAAFGRLFLAPVISLRPTFPSHLIPFSAFLVATSLLRDASSSRSALHLPSPPLPAPRGRRGEGSARGWGWRRGRGCRCCCPPRAELGCRRGRAPGAGFGKLSQHRRGGSALASGGRSWKSPGSTPESGCAPAALLPAAGWGLAGARGAEGTLILPLLPCTHHPPSSGPRLRRWALLHPKVGSGEAAERSPEPRVPLGWHSHAGVVAGRQAAPCPPQGSPASTPAQADGHGGAGGASFSPSVIFSLKQVVTLG